MDIPVEGLHIEIERVDFREPYHTTPLTKTHTEWCTKGSRNYRRTAYRTESQSFLLEAYQMITEKQTDILPMLPTEMARGKWSKNPAKRSSK